MLQTLALLCIALAFAMAQQGHQPYRQIADLVKEAETSLLTETSFSSSYSSSSSGRFGIPIEGLFTQDRIEKTAALAISKLQSFAERFPGQKKETNKIKAYAHMQHERVKIHCDNFLRDSEIEACKAAISALYSNLDAALDDIAHMPRPSHEVEHGVPADHPVKEA